MGTLDGKVAFITGAGRGQGRSHALRLAEEGADIIALDVCDEAVGTIGYSLSTPEDLDETIAGVEALGRRAVKGVADVRDLDQVIAVAEQGLAELGRIDVVCANAGIGSWAVAWEMTAEQWKDMIDINLTGVFNAARAALPSMVARGEGGSVILTSSTAGLIGYANTAHYTAAKHGVIGLMKVLAQEAGLHGIRVNAICPTTVNTPLVINDGTFQLFRPDLENPGPADVRERVLGAQHPARRPVDRALGRVRHRRLAGLGRGAVHHRRRAADRRRQRRQEGIAMAGRAAGKVVVITGASQGQGAVEARALQAEGAIVIAVDVRDPVEPIDGVEYRRLDVSSAERLGRAGRPISSGVHGLVNNAGITHREPLWDVTPADLERVLSINLSGPLLGIQALAPLMTGGGSIVNVASLAALTGHFATAYTASKWGLRGVSRSACTELGPLGIRVNTIFPGAMAAPMTATPQAFIDRLLEDIPLGRAGAAEDVAPLVVFLISDESSWISGAEIAVDGGQSAHGGMKGLADLVRAERSRL